MNDNKNTMHKTYGIQQKNSKEKIYSYKHFICIYNNIRTIYSLRKEKKKTRLKPNLAEIRNNKDQINEIENRKIQKVNEAKVNSSKR